MASERRAYEVLLTGKLARTRTEAERIIKQKAVSAGGCDLTCSFFDTGKCNCGGWRKVTKATDIIPPYEHVKVGNGFWRIVPRLSGQGFDQLNGVCVNG